MGFGVTNTGISVYSPRSFSKMKHNATASDCAQALNSRGCESRSQARALAAPMTAIEPEEI